MTDLHVTQVGGEAWVEPNPDLVVTQISAEAWYAIAPALMVTQVGAEVWQSVEVLAPAGTGGARRMTVQLL
jgi:hypothetical protein